ncbi:MAG: hypothetical protein HZC54_00660 [Verrucomicrobia bacterium]|nr:hypothetical protein [Verrucomicrobiota bacterium]
MGKEIIEWRREPVLGLVADGPETDLKPRAWREAHNVRYEAGAVKNALGWSLFSAPPAGDGTPVLAIVPQGDTEGLARVLVATGAKFYRLLPTGGLTALAGGPFHADLNNRWQLDQFANIVYAANLGDPMQEILPAEDAAAALGGNPPRARHLVQFKGHLLAGCIIAEATDYQAIAGSGLDGVGDGLEDWNPADPNSDAELRDIPEGGGPIMGLLRNGSYVLIQKETTSLLLSYIGLPLVYDVQELPQKIGQLSPFAAADCGEAGVAFVSRNGFYRMDAGGNVANIGERVARAWLSDLIFADRERTYAVGLKEQREFLLPYSSLAAGVGPFGRAMVWDWGHDAYATRDCPFTAMGVAPVPKATLAQMQETWDSLNIPWVQSSNIVTWAGDADGKLFVYGNPEMSADGVPMTATLRSGRTAHGDPSRVKLVQRVFVQVSNLSGNQPLNLDIGMSDTPEGAQTWTAKVPVTASGWVDIEAAAHYLDYRLTKTGGTFALEAYAPAYRLLGEW